MCTLAEKENDEVFGTGGEILRSLQRLMGHLAGLRDIELVDLLLERVEGMYALDQVSASPLRLFPDCEGFLCIAELEGKDRFNDRLVKEGETEEGQEGRLKTERRPPD